MRAALRHLCTVDPVLAGIIQRVGPYRIQYTEPDFETLARCIVLQQLSGKAAKAIFARLKAGITRNSRMVPEEVLAVTPEELRRLGLSQRKAEYLYDLADTVRAGIIDFPQLASLSDAAVIEALCAVRGVGVWTAQMFLMFALRRPDVLATGDLGIRTAVRKAYRLRKLPAPARVETLGRRWRPYSSVACWYLWRSAENIVGL
jgi:DNA-3-methyladenine glycosylase II